MTGALICLSLRDVSLRAPSGQVLLNGISFDLNTGATLAVAGPNGAGKTSLLNLISGLQPQTSGEIEIEGSQLSTLKPHERAAMIAVVSQQSTPDARLTLRDYVALGQMPIWAQASAAEHARALDHVLDITRLTEIAMKPLGQVSGGERQRAHIARALAQKPKLLFLDEPTNHLDPDAKGRMLSLIGALGITVVMVVHDLVLIPEFASHVALLKDARLTGFGPVQDVLTPQTVQDTFGVTYLLLPHAGRQIPVLDIQKTNVPI